MTIATKESTIAEHEAAQVERANTSSATPVVFVHGLWLLPLEFVKRFKTITARTARSRGGLR